MRSTMEIAINGLLGAIFTEVLPASVQEELKEKNYEVEVCEGYVKVSTTQLYEFLSTNGEENNDGMEMLKKFCFNDEAIEEKIKNSSEYINYFKKFELDSSITISPFTREFQYEEHLTHDLWCDESWLNAYVEYRISLTTQDISGAIKAAKKFAGLE